MALAQDFAVNAGQSGAHHGRTVKDAFDGQAFQVTRIGQQGASFLAKLLPGTGLGLGARVFARLAKQPKRLLGKLAGLTRILVIVYEQIERIRAGPAKPELDGQDARLVRLRRAGVPEGCPRPDCWRTGEHLLPAADRLADQFNEHRRLAGPGRAVQDRQVLGGQRETNRVLL